MHAINKKAKAVFDEIRGKMVEGYLKLNNGASFMPVIIEQIGAERFSVAHYGECNGDLMADPEVVFWFKNGEYYPIQFTNHWAGVCRDAVDYHDDGRIKGVFVKEQKDQADFCNIWFNNIKEQQDL